MNSLAGWMGLWTVAICAACEPTAQPVEPERASRRGESCGASNDCESGLACINQRCVQDEFPISSTAKQCLVVDCSTSEDCCDTFMEPAACDTYRAQCDGGDDNYCDIVAENCECRLECVADRCRPKATTCEDDMDCGALVCEGGECVQCRADSDCGDGTCKDTFCQDKCQNDEECPLFHACKAGACEETGCKSDRECILLTGDALAVCNNEKRCDVPCSSNVECGDLQVCKSGSCIFVGCENDVDCRSYFQHIGANLDEGDRAVCRAEE